jgi:leucyl aminopeptidase
MKTKLAGPDYKGLECDALILIEFEGAPRSGLAPLLSPFRESGEITGKFLEFTLLHSPAGLSARRVLLAGGGKREKFDASALRRLTAAAARLLKAKGVRNVAVALETGLDSPDHVAAAVKGAVEGIWEPDRLKTSADKDSSKTIDELLVCVPSASPESPELEAAMRAGRIAGEAAGLARDISVEPPNLLTPLALAMRAQAMAEANGLGCEILDQDRMRQLGMGALLGVAQGSAAPPALIILKYQPERPSSDANLALIGKGVTFDTGGISIKPSDGMEKMKYDMCGAAAVIGAMQAIAQMKPPVAVTGIVPAVENMPGGKAQRPGDIVTSLSGTTIEILNTDAEGRLILADAITYAKQLGCTHLIDAATLTGAIVVALGTQQSGVFTNNDELLGRWMKAAEGSGEKMWHMPAEDEYREQLKTVYADIGNVGGRAGGASTAAVFLKEFVGDTPWIHVDIAGTAWLDDAKPYMAKGPTAVPLGTFVKLAQDWK